jgi:hypothetical protein
MTPVNSWKMHQPRFHVLIYQTRSMKSNYVLRGADIKYFAVRQFCEISLRGSVNAVDARA